MNRPWLLLLLLLWQCIGISLAQGLPEYDVSDQKLDLHSMQLRALSDTSGQFDIRQPGAVQRFESESRLVDSAFVLPGYTAVHWFEIRLRNNGSVPVRRFVVIDEVDAERLDLYERDGNDWLQQTSGLVVPISERPTHSLNPAFLVDLQPAESKAVYLRMETPFRLMNFTIRVQASEVFLNGLVEKSWLFFFFFGAALIISLYNFFLYAALRDRIYLYYVLFGVFFLLSVVAYGGYHLLIRDSLKLHYLMQVPIHFSTVFLVLFMRRLLELPRHLPKLDRLAQAIAGLMAALGVAVAIDVSNLYYSLILGMPVALTLLGIALYAWRAALPMAGSFAVGQMFLLGGMTALVGVNVGLLPYNLFTSFSYIIGALLEMLCLALILAHRVRSLELQQKESRALLLKQQSDKAAELSQLIAERTHELQLANAELEKLSYLDSLTGVNNRRFFDQKLTERWHPQYLGMPLALIMCDLDYFKHYNDTYGHQAGDDCIRLVSNVLRSELRKAGDVCSRYGGEEFALILPNTTEAGGIALAERLRQQVLDLAIPHIGTLGRVSVSFGVASCVVGDGTESAELVARADRALYQSKSQGRNRVCGSALDADDDCRVAEYG
ncbi:sensor domain-containing diguanylate cyclase [Parathalassolituus penaei]|uniref:diguanylate cyclase n=1 Tax=Parathalassolituus penaei TaxID=2997323 RepID=A0A9X3ED81_9GAMM|nr:diguanylate cyclase [Parathalassolituus penaei]MCY0965414.1 sensor domain-containing diguanylate cyclase [Parathalassolituus penaei]